MQLDLTARALERLQSLVSGSIYEFLGYKLDLKTGFVEDHAKPSAHSESNSRNLILSILLSHYAKAHPTPPTDKLVTFREIRGGQAYEKAFIARAMLPIANCFGDRPGDLLLASKKLNGKPVHFGDVAIQIEALKGIPLTYILWTADEFPASASVLFDASASDYLPTEDLAVLGELTSARLIEVVSSK